MEKVTHAPLIAHLKSNAEQYNQMYREQELRFGSMPDRLINDWIVQTVEPIVRATSKTEDESGKIFRELYRSLLPLLGNQLAITFEKEYHAAWAMIASTPHLAQTSPQRLINAINSALISIRKYRPDQVTTWINHMTSVIHHCQTIDELLHCGRVFAWTCGLVQLRAKGIESLGSLSDRLLEIFTQRTGFNAQELISRRWSSEKPVFVGVAGGFAGLDGVFTEQPTLSLYGDQIMAKDDRTICAVYADLFGTLVLPDIPVLNRDLQTKGKEDFHSVLSEFGKQTIPFDDVTSSVRIDNTLIITRSSSFHLFIYGWN